MNLVEFDRALRQLRLSGMAAVLETRLRHAKTEKLTPIDLVSMLVTEMSRILFNKFFWNRRDVGDAR